MNRLVIVYDISDNKIRTSLCKILERVCLRLQESVFIFQENDGECKILFHDIHTFYMRYKKKGNIQIGIFTVCEKCFKAAKFYGENFLLFDKTVIF